MSSQDSDRTDHALDLQEHGVDLEASDHMEIEFGEMHLTAADVGEHEFVEKAKAKGEEEKQKAKAKKRGEIHLVSSTAASLQQMDTSWATEERGERMLTYKTLVRMLIDANADLNIRDDQGFTCLDHCFHFGTYAFDILHVLQFHGAQNSLFYAAYFGHHQLLSDLLRKGQDPRIVNRRFLSTALHLAAESGNDRCVECLLDAECDTEMQDTHGRQPIHYAAANDLDSVKLLLRYLANVNARDHEGLSPLDFTYDTTIQELLEVRGAILSLFGSVIGGHADRVKILVEQRADLMERNKLERTVFHIAATFKNTAVLKVLTGARRHLGHEFCNVNAQDYIGWTPLHYAVEKRRTKAVEVLLKAGADPQIQDHMESNAYQYALEYEWTNIVHVMRPWVPNAATYDQLYVIHDGGEVDADDGSGVVQVRIPPPQSADEIPPMRKSGCKRVVTFY
jgi:ankyrin repeat protein